MTINYTALKISAVVFIAVLLLDAAAGAIFIPGMSLNIRTFHPYYHHGLKENGHSMENWTPAKQYELFTNSLGFRDAGPRFVALKNEEQKERIVFIGDSFVEGVGVPYEKTFVGIVADALKRDGTEVINAGVASYSAITSYLKIKYLIENKGLQFDELYVFYDLSDPYNDYMLEKFEHFTPHETEPLASLLLRKTSSFLNAHSYVVYNFNIIYPYIKYRKYEQGFLWWTLQEDVYRDWAKTGLEISENYMQKLVKLCKKNTIRVTLAVYPWYHLIGEKDLHSRMVVFWERFAKEQNIAFLNYFPDFITGAPAAQIIDRYFLPDDIHWNEEGHRLIAEKIIRGRKRGTKGGLARGRTLPAQYDAVSRNSVL